MASTLPAVGPTRQGRSSRFDRVDRVGLAGPPALLAVGPVHLDDADVLVLEVAGEAGSVAAGAFHADQHDGAEALKPDQQLPIARSVGGEGLDTQQPADGAECGGDVGVEVGVDPSGDLIWHGGHGSSLLLLGGGAPAGRDGGQDNDGPLGQAPSRSLPPDWSVPSG
jgi:hypothetical protein